MSPVGFDVFFGIATRAAQGSTDVNLTKNPRRDRNQWQKYP
jgi:hypothetical protein